MNLILGGQNSAMYECVATEELSEYDFLDYSTFTQYNYSTSECRLPKLLMTFGLNGSGCTHTLGAELVLLVFRLRYCQKFLSSGNRSFSCEVQCFFYIVQVMRTLN